MELLPTHNSKTKDTEGEKGSLDLTNLRSLPPPAFSLNASPPPDAPPAAGSADSDTSMDALVYSAVPEQDQKKVEDPQKPLNIKGIPVPMISDEQLQIAVKKNKRSWKQHSLDQWNIFQDVEAQAPFESKQENFAYRVWYLQHLIKGYQQQLGKSIFKKEPDGIYTFFLNRYTETLMEELTKRKAILLDSDQKTFLQTLYSAYETHQDGKVKGKSLKSSNLNMVMIFGQINRNINYLLARGMRHKGVGTLQGILKELGYLPSSHRVSNYFNTSTKTALTKFQRISGLAKNPMVSLGALDHRTLRELDRVWSSNEKSQEKGYLGTSEYKVFTIPVYKTQGHKLDAAVAYSRIFRVPLAVVLKHPSIFRDMMTRGKKRVSFTNSDIRQGFAQIRMSTKGYSKIQRALYDKGIISDAKRKDKAPALRKSMQHLEGRETLIHKKVELERLKAEHDEKESFWRGQVDPTGEQIKRLKFQQKEEKLESEIEQERQKLGLDEDTEERDEKQFINQFKQVAIQTGNQMLEGNLHKISAFQNKFQEDLKFKRQLQKLLIKLSEKYNESDRLREKAVRERGILLRMKDQLLQSGKDPKEKEKMPEGIDGLRDYFINPPDKNFRAWADLETEIHGNLSGNVQKFPILAHPGLNLRAFSKKVALQGSKNPKPGGQKQQQYDFIDLEINQLLGKAGKRTQKVEINKENVWQFEPVIAKAKERMGIPEDSAFDKLIQQWQQKAGEPSTWKTVLDWSLAIGSLLSGPVGWLAATGGLAVSVNDAHNDYKKIKNQKTAEKATLHKKDALIKESEGWGWLIADLVLLGYDVVDAVKITQKLAKNGKPAIKKGELSESNGDEIVQAAGELAKEKGKKSWEFNFLKKLAGRTLTLIDKLKSSTVKRKFIQFLKNDRLRKAFQLLYKMQPNAAAFRKVVRHFVGAGSALVKSLPEVLQRLKQSGISALHPLYKGILTKVNIRAMFLTEGPAATLKAWREYTDKIWTKFGKGIQGFSRSLHNKYRHVTDKMGVDELSRTFGKVFHGYSHVRKNKELLRVSKYSKALDVFLANPKMDPGLKAAWKKYLEKDRVRLTLSKDRAVRQAEKDFEALLSNHMKDMTDFTRFKIVGAFTQGALESKILTQVTTNHFEKTVDHVIRTMRKDLPENFVIPQGPEQMEAMKRLLLQAHTGQKGATVLHRNRKNKRFNDVFLHLMYHPAEDPKLLFSRTAKGEKFDLITKQLAKPIKRNSKYWDNQLALFEQNLKDPDAKAAIQWIRTTSSIAQKDRQALLRRLFKNVSGSQSPGQEVTDFLKTLNELNQHSGGEMKGLSRLLTSLASRNGGTQSVAGATLVLRHTHELRKAGKLDSAAELEHGTTVKTTGQSREYDIKNGKKNIEVKFWTDPNSIGIRSYIGKADLKGGKRKLSQFERDLLINANDLSNFQLVIAAEVAKDHKAFKDALFKQMEAKFMEKGELWRLLKKEGKNPAKVWTGFKKEFQKDLVFFQG